MQRNRAKGRSVSLVKNVWRRGGRQQNGTTVPKKIYTMALPAILMHASVVCHCMDGWTDGWMQCMHVSMHIMLMVCKIWYACQLPTSSPEREREKERQSNTTSRFQQIWPQVLSIGHCRRHMDATRSLPQRAHRRTARTECE